MASHIYREYANLGITICQNCARFQKDILAADHSRYDHGYCDPACLRCEAEICTPPAMGLIKPLSHA